MANSNTAQIAILVKELSGASRRRRQEVAHQLALTAKANPQLMFDYVEELIDALFRP